MIRIDLNKKLSNFQGGGKQGYVDPMKYKPVVGKRKGARKNPDGSESTHLMAYAKVDKLGGYVAFPTLFQNEQGEFYEPQDPIAEAIKKNEIYRFGNDLESAKEFAAGSWKSRKQGGGKTKYFGETEQGGYTVGVNVDRGDRQRSKSFSLEPSGDVSYSRSVSTPQSSRTKVIDILDGKGTKTITRTRGGETTERTKTLGEKRAERLRNKYERKVNRVFTDPSPEVPNPNSGKFLYQFNTGGIYRAQDANRNAAVIDTPSLAQLTERERIESMYPGQYDFTTSTKRYYGDEPTIDPRTQTITSKNKPATYDYFLPLFKSTRRDVVAPPVRVGGTTISGSETVSPSGIKNDDHVSLNDLNNIVRPIVDEFVEKNIEDIRQNPSSYHLTQQQPAFLKYYLSDDFYDDFPETKPGMPDVQTFYVDDEEFFRQGNKIRPTERYFDLSDAGLATGQLHSLLYRPGYTQYDVTTEESNLRAPEAPDKIEFDRDKFMTDAATANQRDMRLSQNFLIDYLEKEPSRAGKTYYYYDDDEGNILYATGQPRFGTQGNQAGEEQEYLRQFEQFTTKDGSLRTPKVISSKDNPNKFKEVEDRIYDFAYENIDGSTPTFQGQSNPGGGIMQSGIAQPVQSNQEAAESFSAGGRIKLDLEKRLGVDIDKLDPLPIATTPKSRKFFQENPLAAIAYGTNPFRTAGSTRNMG